MSRDDADEVLEALEVRGTLTTETGISASITRSHEAEVLRVVDADGRLLFEHHTGTRVTVIVAPEGDLELRAPHGKVKIVAAGGVEVDTPSLSARVGEARVEGRTLSTTFDRVRSVVGVLETRAGRVLERAKSVYREVEGLSQTRAGRLRLVAETTASLLGQRTVVKAKEDVKVKGDKVYLA